MTEAVRIQTRANKIKPFRDAIKRRIASIKKVTRRTREDKEVINRLENSLSLLK